MLFKYLLTYNFFFLHNQNFLYFFLYTSFFILVLVLNIFILFSFQNIFKIFLFSELMIITTVNYLVIQSFFLSSFFEPLLFFSQIFLAISAAEACLFLSAFLLLYKIKKFEIKN